jgi:formylmethanofuran dehydrogenase subunit E
MFERFRGQVNQYIINAADDEILSIREVGIPEPEKARIYPSLKCQECGESFMEICGRTVNGKVVCKECFQRMAG